MISNKGTKTTEWEKRQSFQQMMLSKQDIHKQKNEAGPFPNSIYKN